MIEAVQEIKNLKFTTKDMRVMSMEEALNLLNDPPLTEALKCYHETQFFTQTLQQFKTNPQEYFSKRLTALENLIKAIPENDENGVYHLIRTQAYNKKIYLESLPPGSDPRCLKQEVLSPFVALDLKLGDHYWFETLDPLHRFGVETKMYLDRWMTSSIPNYFIYLETVEYDPLLDKYAPQTNYLHYYTDPEARKEHRLYFEQGKAFLNGQPFDTTPLDSTNEEYFEENLYMVGLDGEFYVHPHVIDDSLHHSSVFAGGDLLSAGQIEAFEGKILKISNLSGHYKPGIQAMLDTVQVLKSKNYPLEELLVEMVLSTTKPELTKKVAKRVTVFFNAEEFLQNSGRAKAISALAGWTSCHVAAWQGYLDHLEVTTTPQTIDAQTDEGSTPLHLACEQGHKELVLKLLDKGANPYIRNEEGNTALHIAAKEGHIEIMRILLTKSSFALDDTNNKGATPLLLAAESGKIQALELMMTKGASPYIVDSAGNAIFHYAASNRIGSQMVKHLLTKSFQKNIFTVNNNHANVLHRASEKGVVQTLEFLTKLGFTPEDTDNSGNTALHYGAMGANTETVHYLLNHYANSDLMFALNDHGVTAFHLAASQFQIKTLKLFIKQGMPLDLPDQDGNTPLFYVLKNKNKEAKQSISLLLTLGANPHIYNKLGMAPIHVAAESSNLLNTMMLLTFSDDINLLDINQRTPLEIALQTSNHRLTSYFQRYIYTPRSS